MTKGYSGADISSVCREAAINALRRDINANEVTLGDFEKAMEKVPPSISPEIEDWYRSFMKQVRRMQKPTSLAV
jgi:transitional endoplasmic reticulum ATPase